MNTSDIRPKLWAGLAVLQAEETGRDSLLQYSLPVRPRKAVAEVSE